MLLLLNAPFPLGGSCLRPIWVLRALGKPRLLVVFFCLLKFVAWNRVNNLYSLLRCRHGVSFPVELVIVFKLLDLVVSQITLILILVVIVDHLVITRSIRPLHEHWLSVAPRKECSALHLGRVDVLAVDLQRDAIRPKVAHHVCELAHLLRHLLVVRLLL